jgi:dTMP kinase
MRWEERIIAVDGIDKSGKSSQVALLHEWLISEGAREVVSVKHPDTLRVAGIMRALLLGHPVTQCRGEMRQPYGAWTSEGDVPVVAARSHLFLAEALHTYETRVRPALLRGATVVYERTFPLSNVAYRHGEGMVLSDAQALTAAAGFPAPDLAIILDIPITLARARAAMLSPASAPATHFDVADDAALRRRRDGYLACVCELPWATCVDGSKTVSTVHAAIRAILSQG